MAKTKKTHAFGVVVPGYLNVRENPAGKIIGIIKKGTVVEILQEQKGWARVHTGDCFGWVACDYLEAGGRVE